MSARSIKFLFFMAALWAAVTPAAAQEEPLGNSYLAAFPPGEVYNVIVVGDDLAEGLLYGLTEAFAGDQRLQIRSKHFSLNGLNRPDFPEKLAALEDELKREPANVAVLMLGAWDRVTLRDGEGKRIPVGSPAWRTEYAQRADRVMKALKQQNVSVYWVGLPNVRKYDYNEDAQMMNDVLRERIYLNGMKYIDAYAGFVDEQGGYDPFGPDISGERVRLRDGDGVYFTGAGNRKLAHFVERELKRDLTQAKAERTIPLAGSEAEQAKINPDKEKLATAPADKVTAKAAGTGAAPGAATPQPTVAASDEQKADNGKISLRAVGASGREEVIAVDIVRPAIPASVIQLVTRRESPDRLSQMGDVLMDQIGDGLTVMSSVSPPSTSAAGGRRSKLSAAQTPYFRVLFKGERLTPKPGRADDVSWPRAEAPQPAAAAPAPSVGDTGSTPLPQAPAARKAGARDARPAAKP